MTSWLSMVLVKFVVRLHQVVSKSTLCQAQGYDKSCTQIFCWFVQICHVTSGRFALGFMLG